MGNGKYLFLLQHKNEAYDLMPFSIAMTWIKDKEADIAFYLMYDSVKLARKQTISENAALREVIDDLLDLGVPIYVCGFCTRACEYSPETYYQGIEIANRHIYYSLMMERRVINY